MGKFDRPSKSLLTLAIRELKFWWVWFVQSLNFE